MSSDLLAEGCYDPSVNNNGCYFSKLARFIQRRKIFSENFNSLQHSSPTPILITSPRPGMSIPIPSLREVLFFDKAQSALLSTLSNPSSTSILVIRNAAMSFC